MSEVAERARLDNVAALVTGAGSGLGRAVAQALHRRGAFVGSLDVNAAAVQELASSLGSRMVGLATDVSDEAGIEAAVAQVAAVRQLRVAVACHGVLRPELIASQSRPLSARAVSDVIQTNLVGTYTVLQACARQMTSNEPDEDGQRGTIILTASIAAYEGQIGQAAYSASKAGVVGLVLPAARELARWGIRVCAIAPGVFDTPMLGSISSDARAAIEAEVPFPPRLGRPAEFAQLVEHVLENRFLNGTTIRLDGGLRLSAR